MITLLFASLFVKLNLAAVTSPIINLIRTLADTFGVSPAVMAGLLAVLVAISKVAEFVGKLIPDSATGFWAIVRKVCKVIGVYIPNRA